MSSLAFSMLSLAFSSAALELLKLHAPLELKEHTAPMLEVPSALWTHLQRGLHAYDLDELFIQYPFSNRLP